MPSCVYRERIETLPSDPPDLALGAFSAEGPWIVEPDRLVWRRGLDRDRARTRAGVPGLLEAGRLPPVGRLARALTSVGVALAGWYLVERPRGGEVSRRGLSRRLRRAFERLGSSYVKLGQILSSGEGLFPEELVGEFKLLRDQVPPEPFDDVRTLVERELGARLGAVFASFDEQPLAAASIAQVHAARLRSGEDVVVKVQRPRVAELVRADLGAMAWLAPRLVGRIPIAALANPPALVELFAETVVEELDFRLEAENMLDIAAVLATTGQRAIVVPRPHPTLVTRRLLVMERLHGFAFDDVESMRAAGIDTGALLRAGLIAFLEGALLFGVFHGDLHGGNLLVQRDGRTALLDFGITGRLAEPERVAFLRLLVMGSAGDVRGQVAALRDLGAFPPETDLEAVVRDLDLEGPVKDPTTMSADELTAELGELTRKLLGYGARAPKELMLFVKNMIFLDGATATLAPDLDILGEIAHVYLYFVREHGERIARELGLDPARPVELDIDAVRASLGVGDQVERLTYRDVQRRRETVRERLRERRGPSGPE
ncbi:MAG: AarF/UbiB family protein [Acidimicrobiia bacterium]|nr:AarF/UbiB family protein [Acidimicrobiia bacterium]